MLNSEKCFDKLSIVVLNFKDEYHSKYEFAHFESLSEMAEKLKKGYDEEIFPKGNNLLENFYEGACESWTFGGSNFNELYSNSINVISDEKFVNSVQELRKIILQKESIKELCHQQKTLKKKRIYSENGSELDIDRLLCGDPQHWVSTTPGKKNNIIRLGVNIATNAGIEPVVMQKISAIAIIATELLTMAGFHVELNCIDITYIIEKNTYSGEIFKIKKATEKIDINRICSFAHIGVVRCFGFCIINEIVDVNFGKNPSYFYHGSSCKINEFLRNKLEYDFIIDGGITIQDLEIKLDNLIKINQ